MRESLRSQQQGAEQGDLVASARLDGEFQALFCEFLGNRDILGVIRQLRERMKINVGPVLRQNFERMASCVEYALAAWWRQRGTLRARPPEFTLSPTPALAEAPIAPGAPLCRVHAPGYAAEGREIVFKGGQNGRDDFFLSALRGEFSSVAQPGPPWPATLLRVLLPPRC